MDGFETEKRAECKIHMGEGHNTVCMSLALNFKNNSDQQLFFFSSADSRQTQHARDYSICSLGHRRVFSAASSSPRASLTSSRLGRGYWMKGILSLFSLSPSWSSSSSPASLVSVLSLAICNPTETGIGP